MFRMKCAGWLFFKCLTFIYTISLANFTNTPSPTNGKGSSLLSFSAICLLSLIFVGELDLIFMLFTLDFV